MDYETLFIVMVSVFLIQAIALTLTWRLNPEEIGIRDWAIAAVAISLGSLVTVVAMAIDTDAYGADSLTGTTIVRAIGGSLGATAWLFVWQGSRHFFGKATFAYRNALFFLFLFALLILSNPTDISHADWRIAWVSLVISVFAAFTAYEFKQRKPLQNPAIALMLVILVFTCLIWFLRMLSRINLLENRALYDSLTLYDAIMAGVTLTVLMILLTNERINQKLLEQATRDPLTGAMNRRAFIDASNPYLASLHREANHLAVVVLDIDHFKRINDRYGHSLGDQVLQEFVVLMRATLRDSDLFARYGGEEFVILLHNTNHDQAMQVMQRLRETYAAKTLHVGDDLISVTFSAGICCATGPVQVNLETMLEAADRAMYRAKEAGRNRVEFCPDGIGAGELELLEEH